MNKVPYVFFFLVLLIYSQLDGVKPKTNFKEEDNKMTKKNQSAYSDDKTAIINHVIRIFEAYSGAKRDIVRDTHSDDWTGFMIPSKKIVRGIDGYMKIADAFLETKKMTRYKIDDTEVQIYGDIAILYYQARFWVKDLGADEEELVEVRSVDVYRREKNDWIQIGSNICKIPE